MPSCKAPLQEHCELCSRLIIAGLHILCFQCHANENKNANHSIQKVQNLGNIRWIYKNPHKESGLCNISYIPYIFSFLVKINWSFFKSVLSVLHWKIAVFGCLLRFAFFFCFLASGFRFLVKKQAFFYLLSDVVFHFSNLVSWFIVCMTRLRGNSKLITFTGIFHSKSHIKFPLMTKKVTNCVS